MIDWDSLRQEIEIYAKSTESSIICQDNSIEIMLPGRRFIVIRQNLEISWYITNLNVKPYYSDYGILNQHQHVPALLEQFSKS